MTDKEIELIKRTSVLLGKETRFMRMIDIIEALTDKLEKMCPPEETIPPYADLDD